MGDYATKEQLAARLFQSQAEDLDTLQLLVTAASRAADRFCNVPDGFFDIADDEPSERTVYATGRNYIALPPHIDGSVDSVGSLAESAYTLAGGWLYWPDTVFYPFAGTAYVVTAQWGWEAIPADIQEAVIEMGARWWRSRDEAVAVVAGLNQAPVIERSMPSSARMLLSNMRAELIRRGWVAP